MIDVTLFTGLLTGWFSFVTLYFLMLFLAGLRTPHPSPSTGFSDKLHNFLVLIPAHNEKSVIRGLLSDLVAQDYSQSHLRVLVVLDHCTDGTEEALEGLPVGAVCLNDGKRGGKSSALNRGLQLVEKVFPDFNVEYVVILDADNRVKPSYLTSLNDVLRESPYPAIQTNVRAKNPSASFLTRAQAYEVAVYNRLVNVGKQRLGLCNVFKGTGQVLAYPIAKSFGFGSSLTEDLDLTMKLALAGIRIHYVHFIATFDEECNSLRGEIRRRTRWGAGQIRAIRFAPRLIGKHRKLTLDALMHLTSIYTPLLILASYAISVLSNFGFTTSAAIPIPSVLILALTISTPLVVGITAHGESEELRFLPGYLIFNFIWLLAVPLAVVKVLRRDHSWSKTPHVAQELEIGLDAGEQNLGRTLGHRPSRRNPSGIVFYRTFAMAHGLAESCVQARGIVMIGMRML